VVGRSADHADECSAVAGDPSKHPRRAAGLGEVRAPSPRPPEGLPHSTPGRRPGRIRGGGRRRCARGCRVVGRCQVEEMALRPRCGTETSQVQILSPRLRGTPLALQAQAQIRHISAPSLRRARTALDRGFGGRGGRVPCRSALGPGRFNPPRGDHYRRPS